MVSSERSSRPSNHEGGTRRRKLHKTARTPPIFVAPRKKDSARRQGASANLRGTERKVIRHPLNPGDDAHALSEGGFEVDRSFGMKGQAAGVACEVSGT